MDLGDLDLFAGIRVTDVARAARWYEQLLGAAPTFWPHDREAVWVLAEHRALYVVEDPDHADHTGHATVTVMVGSLDDLLDAAAGRGVAPRRVEEYGTGVRKAVFTDPDGNEVGVGEVPGA